MSTGDNPDPGNDPDAGPAAGLTGLDRYMGLLLLGSVALLLAGWLLPVMTVETLFIFEDEVSILAACYRLLENGDFLLFTVVTVFTIIFPTAKLTLAYLALRRINRAGSGLLRAVQWIETVGKWSMLDVFVVALVVVVIKMSAVSDISIEPGLYVFIAAVVASMLVVRRICRLAVSRVEN